MIEKHYEPKTVTKGNEGLPEIVFEIFKNVKVEVDPTSCLRGSPAQFIQSSKEHPSDIVSLQVTYDLEYCSSYVKQFTSTTKLLNTGKVFADEHSIASFIYMIEVVKKAWFFGQVSNSEFTKFLGLIKNLHFLRIFPYVIGCFRLMNIEEITREGYNPLVELCTVVLNQALLQCDVAVPTEMLIYAETYFVSTKNTKVYILDKLKTNKIFTLKEFWECHLLWLVNKKVQSSDHSSRKSIDLRTIIEISRNNVASEIRSTILTMARAGLDKSIAQDIIHSMLDKFKLDQKNREIALDFLKVYQAEKPTLPKDAKLLLDIDESQFF